MVQREAIGRDAVLSAIARITSSKSLAGSPQLVAFLSFVVQEELEGRGDRLKGYTISTEALGRPPEFDPGSDPIVRVEARRLRLALAAYYEDEGRDDPVLVSIPPGGYRPTFSYRRAGPGSNRSADEPAPSRWTGRHAQDWPVRLVWALIGLTVLNLVVLAAVLASVVEHQAVHNACVTSHE